MVLSKLRVAIFLTFLKLGQITCNQTDFWKSIIHCLVREPGPGTMTMEKMFIVIKDTILHLVDIVCKTFCSIKSSKVTV